MRAADDSKDDAPGQTPPRGRLAAALVFFLASWIVPGAGAIMLAMDISTALKAVGGALIFPVPEFLSLIAIAILGKPGYVWLKRRVMAMLRRYAPPDEVGPGRYRLGLALFSFPLLFGWLVPYVLKYLPWLDRHLVAANLACDLMFFASLFVLGGNFWDKLKALFIRRARAVLPDGQDPPAPVA